MVATCAAAALFAPAAGASTLTATHLLSATGPTPVTYTADPAEGNHLRLTGDGTSVSFSEDVALINPDLGVGGLDSADDCTASGTTSATCLPAPTTVDLGDGDDTLTLGDGLPPLTVDGGIGTDRLDFSPRTAGMALDLAAPQVAPNVTETNVEAVTGTQGDDTITGNDVGNRLSGGSGNDTITGGQGTNALRGGAGDDTLTAGNSGDALVGGPGVDTINGGAGDDNISAADGVADKITCGAGTDSVSADATDTFAVPGDCEEVTIAGASVPDPVPTTTTEGAVTTTDTSVIFVPALGSIVPVLAPGKASIADLTPPAASIRSFTRQRIATVLSRGVPVRVTCQEACGISVALSVDRTAARRLKLDARSTPVVVGTAVATRTIAGTTRLRVTFTKAARTALKRSARNVATTTQVLVSDSSGNGTLLSRHVTLVR
ncbi:MAG: hypothetical protein QOH72_5105 [Solirubrobacteraceae bacterium]|nr:hypothetical protein [Solirubrobacteraceae bacterium]